MSCDRVHIEDIMAALNSEQMGMYPPYKTFAAISRALSLADESPCVWNIGDDSGDYTPGCAPDTSTAAGGWRFVWSRGFRKSMTYCPHCGRKIKDGDTNG